MRVFVTDGDSRAALAVTRSLGAAGHEVFVGERFTPCLAHASRHCARAIVYPNPVVDSAAFVDGIDALVTTHRIDVLLPVADIPTLLLTAQRARFDGRCAVPFAAAEAIDRAANKVDMLTTAESLGVPVPRSVIVHSLDQAEAGTFEYPMVIKPGRSRVRTSAGWASSGVSYAADRNDLLRDLRARPSHDFPLLLQERIVGPGLGVFACYDHGRPVALFSHRRLRERPPWGGVSVLSESVPMDPVARDAATTLLDALQWHGVAMVEFKRDLRDGLPRLMEINGRFWGSLQLAVDAGVDFPALLVRTVSHPGSVTAPAYRAGVRSRWLWGDVDSLLIDLFGRRSAATTGRPSRLRSILAFLEFWGRDLYYENPQWNDLGPWRYETVEWLKQLRSRRAKADTAKAGAITPLETPSAEVFDSLDDVAVPRDEWNALAATSPSASIFQTHDWVHSWWDTVGADQSPLVVKVLRGTTPVAVAPLMVASGRKGRRVVRFSGDERADYCDIVAGPDHGMAASAVADALLARTDWDEIDLSRLPSTSPSIAALEAAAHRHGRAVLVSDEYVCPALMVAGHEREVRSIIDRPSVRRPQRYFERQGRLEVRDLRSWTEVAPLMDQFFAQHIARWQDTGTPSLFVDPRNARFYRRMAERVAAAGWLLFSVVELNGEPIAFHLGFDYRGTITWYKPSFDVRQARHSPGLVMIRHLIELALAEGSRMLDFTLGDEPFKLRFANHMGSTRRVQIFADNVGYAFERSRRSLSSALKMISHR